MTTIEQILGFLRRGGWVDGLESAEFLAAGEYNENFLVLGRAGKFMFRVNHGSQLGLDNQIEYEFQVLNPVEPSGVTFRPLFCDPGAEGLGRGVLLIQYLPGRNLDYPRDRSRAPVSLTKLVVEDHSATVLYHTAYNPYFRTNRKVFRATDFIAELLQHLPDPRVRLIRRYGLYSSRSRGTWLRKPHLARLAPEGWRQDHTAQPALRIGLEDTQYAETSVSSRESRSAWARLIAKVYEADPLVCPRCGSPMRIMAVITEPQQVRKIQTTEGCPSPDQDRKCPASSGSGLLETESSSPSPARNRSVLSLSPPGGTPGFTAGLTSPLPRLLPALLIYAPWTSASAAGSHHRSNLSRRRAPQPRT